MSSIDFCDMYSPIGLSRICLAVLMTVSSLTLDSLDYGLSVSYYFHFCRNAWDRDRDLIALSLKQKWKVYRLNYLII